jgi:hypothetical protein
MDPNLAANPYFQLGVAGGVMVFTLSIVGLFIRHIKGRDTEWQKFFGDQTALWRNFLEGERTQRREVMDHAYGDFSKNMQSIATGLGMLTKEMNDSHMDIRLRQETILAAIETINGGKAK